MKTATFIREVNKGANGHQRLYRLSEPITYDDDFDEPGKQTKFIVVSSVHALFSGPETYIFPSDDTGKIIDWGELDGSFKGGLCHETALEGAGFRVIDPIPA